MMFGLSENMRAVNKQLADELLQPTIDFRVAQADGNRMKPMNLGSTLSTATLISAGHMLLSLALRLQS